MQMMRLEIRLFLTLWLVYALYLAPAGGVLPNRYQDLTYSIVNEGRFVIDTYHENTIDKAYYRGHYYTVALPGPSLLAVPAYLVFKPLYVLLPSPLKNAAAGVQSLKKTALPESSFYGRVDNVEFFLGQMFITLTVQAPFSALGGVLLYMTLRRLGFGLKRAVFVSLCYAFGTMVFFFSTVFFEQVLTATCLIAAFYFLVRARESGGLPGSHRFVFASGLLAGCGLLVEYAAVFAALLFGLAVLSEKNWRRAFLFAVGFVLPVLVLMAYNQANFGSPLATAYRYIDVVQQKNHAEGFFGITYPHVSRLLALLFGVDRGLFLFAPISAIGGLGLAFAVYRPKQKRVYAVLSMLVVLLYLIFYASYTDWRGGATFGPRFLIPTLPFLMIGVAFAFDFIPRWIICVIAFLSFALNWLGAQFGFAESPWEHVSHLVTQGPTLPVFGAILSHASSLTSPLYRFASNYHVVLTLGLSVALGLFLVWWWRDLWRPSVVL